MTQIRLICLMVVLFSSVLMGTTKSPNFSLDIFESKARFELYQAIEKGPVLINFWATWCGPCIIEMKAFKAIKKEFEPQGLQIVSISIDQAGKAAQIKSILHRYQFKYLIALDPQKRVLSQFNPSQIVPFSMIIDTEGQIVYQKNGYSPGDEAIISDTLKKILAVK